MKSKPVRGIANRGPIVKYIIIKNITENLGDILFNEPTYPCLSNAPTITPNNGKPIPVKQNAITAGQRNDHYLGLNLVGK